MTLWPIEAVSEFQAEREDSLRPQRHLTPLPYHRRSCHCSERRKDRELTTRPTVREGRVRVWVKVPELTEGRKEG